MIDQDALRAAIGQPLPGAGSLRLVSLAIERGDIAHAVELVRLVQVRAGETPRHDKRRRYVLAQRFKALRRVCNA